MKKIIINIGVFISIALHAHETPLQSPPPKPQKEPQQTTIQQLFNKAFLSFIIDVLAQELKTQSFGAISEGSEEENKFIADEIIKRSGLYAFKIHVKKLCNDNLPPTNKNHEDYINSTIKTALDILKAMPQKENVLVKKIIFISDLDLAFPGDSTYGELSILKKEELKKTLEDNKHIILFATIINKQAIPQELLEFIHTF